MTDSANLSGPSDEARRQRSGAAEALSPAVSEADVACLLAETGHAWSPSSDDPHRWCAAVTDATGHRGELTASIAPGGVEVSVQLGAWAGELSSPVRAALVRYLAACEGQIRFVRFMLLESQATAIAFAAAKRLEVELPGRVGAVAQAHHRAWRAVRALTNETVARAYLEITQGM